MDSTLEKYKEAEVLVSAQTGGFSDAEWIRSAKFNDYVDFSDFLRDEVFEGSSNWHVIDSVELPEPYLYRMMPVTSYLMMVHYRRI